MIWLMTIVTFLGAVVAAMLVFLFLFQREQIRAALRKSEQQRMEVGFRRELGWSSLVQMNHSFTKPPSSRNVSRHRARVVTKRRWRPNDSVLVKLPQECLPSRARITYCQPLMSSQWVCSFSLVVYSWRGSL